MKLKKEESEGKERVWKVKKNLQTKLRKWPLWPEYEVRRHKTARRPLLHTKAAIDEHYHLHVSSRSWCKHCVAGKARSNQHIQVKRQRLDLELLGVQIMFL